MKNQTNVGRSVLPQTPSQRDFRSDDGDIREMRAEDDQVDTFGKAAGDNVMVIDQGNPKTVYPVFLPAAKRAQHMVP